MGLGLQNLSPFFISFPVIFLLLHFCFFYQSNFSASPPSRESVLFPREKVSLRDFKTFKIYSTSILICTVNFNPPFVIFHIPKYKYT